MQEKLSMQTIANRFPQKVRIFFAVLLTVVLVPCPCFAFYGALASREPGSSSGLFMAGYTIILLLFLGVLVSVWWFALRRCNIDLPQGFCTACGYDLRGNMQKQCPECGEPMEPT